MGLQIAFVISIYGGSLLAKRLIIIQKGSSQWRLLAVFIAMPIIAMCGAQQTHADEAATAEPCQAKLSMARKVCNPLEMATKDKDSAMFLEGILNQAGPGIAQALDSSDSINDSCKKGAKITGLLAAMNGARGGACKMAINSCVKICEASINSDIAAGNPPNPSFAENKKKCEKYNANFAMMMAQMMSLGMNFAQNKACEKATEQDAAALAAANAALTTLPPPSSLQITTAADCNNPSNASSPECLCVLNPRAPTCANGLVGGGGSLAGNSSANALTGVGNGDLGDDDSGGTGSGFNANKNKGLAGGATGAGGGGSSGFGSGGSGGSANANDRDTAAAGATSGTSTWGLGGAGGGGGGFRYGRAPGSSPKSAQDALKKFSDQFKLKLAASEKSSGAAAGAGTGDGITGPNGPTIWEKVTRQYQRQKQELLAP